MDPNNPSPIDPADNQIQARLLMMDYFNQKVEKTDVMSIGLDEVYVVWYTFLLGYWKGLLSTTISDGMYYEVTYNKEKGETYLDAYKKWENVCIPDGESLSL